MPQVLQFLFMLYFCVGVVFYTFALDFQLGKCVNTNESYIVDQRFRPTNLNQSGDIRNSSRSEGFHTKMRIWLSTRSSSFGLGSPPIVASDHPSQDVVDVRLSRLFGLGLVFERLFDFGLGRFGCSLVSLQLVSSSHPSRVEGTLDCDVVSEIVDRLLAWEGLFEVFLCHGRQTPCDLLGQAVELGIVTWDELPAFGRPATTAPAGAGLGLGWANELQSRVGVKGTEVVEQGSFGPCACDVDLHNKNSVWCGVVRAGLTGPPGFPSLTKDCFRGVGAVNRASTHTRCAQPVRHRTINERSPLETI